MYDPNKVDVVVASFTVTGIADSIVKVTRITEDLYKSQVGLYGETLWSKQFDRRANLTFSLYQNSPANAKLYLFSLSPIALPVLIKNTTDGKYLAGGSDARVLRRPNVEYKAAAAPWIWTIQVNDYMEAFLASGKVSI